MTNQSQWNSRTAFLLSMIWAAVGLGNIWRYSYVVYSNGGGTFFIPYLIAILIMGIPFLILEYGIGFRHKDSFSNILKGINPKLEYMSWGTGFDYLLCFNILSCHCKLGFGIYIGSSINFSWEADSALYFVKNVGGSSNLSNMANFIIPTTVSMVIVWIFVWYISHKDLNENDRVKVGKSWMFVLKYILPIFLFLMWGTGVYNLLLDANNFELIIYGMITVAILILSYIFTNISEKRQ